MFKVSNEFVKGLTDKIADLEAKLAESELKYNATNRAYWELVEKQDNSFSQYEKLIGENQQLKQQLAEKDEEIESWKQELRDNKHDFNMTILEKDQDKISFAVEQLEFLKNEIKMIGHISNCTVLPERELICRFDVFRFIDNQKKQLKEKYEK
jgi:chromosome segregation ATPase